MPTQLPSSSLPRHALAAAFLCLAVSPGAATAPLCDESILAEGLATIGDLDCISDMKKCIRMGTCAVAGISETRICQCYRKGKLPAPGRDLSDYQCRPTESAQNTILNEYNMCRRKALHSEL